MRAGIRKAKAAAGKRSIQRDGSAPHAKETFAPGAPLAVFVRCQVEAGDFPFFSGPDFNAAANNNRILIASNAFVQVRRRTDECPLVSNVPLNDFFDAFPHSDTENLIHPRVIVDPASGRLFISAASFDTQNGNQFQYVAVSTNANLTEFNQARVRLSQGVRRFCKRTIDNQWDTLTLGVSGDRLFITAIDADFPADIRGAILDFDKQLLIDGGPGNDVVCFNNLEPGIVAPIVADQSTRAFFPTLLSNVSDDFTHIARYRLNIAGSTGNDTLTLTPKVNIPDASPPPDAAQPNGQLLETGSGHFSAPTHQRGNFFWVAHTIDDGGFARTRLYKVPTVGTAPAFTFTPTSVAGDNDHLFNGSVAVSTNGFAFLNLSRVIPTGGAKGRAAHVVLRGPHSSGDDWVTNVVATSRAQFTEAFPGVPCNTVGACPWGAYSSIMVDPSDPNRVWVANELIDGPIIGDWDGSVGQCAEPRAVDGGEGGRL